MMAFLDHRIRWTLFGTFNGPSVAGKNRPGLANNFYGGIRWSSWKRLGGEVNQFVALSCQVAHIYTASSPNKFRDFLQFFICDADEFPSVVNYPRKPSHGHQILNALEYCLRAHAEVCCQILHRDDLLLLNMINELRKLSL
eukprot:TRINITY_DN14945_c0_g1_i5.p1 TRINITY_DN14945_c0_g1~~TRINITY_DN14945_c0_g1_i5.p1  ORF type:complete len:141 (-),score=7.22 TRINITY_DN14945_c0_g1_i5:241-663(-)